MAQVKERKYFYQVINVKLQTKKSKEEKINAYYKLFDDLIESKIHKRVAENKHMILYSGVKRTTYLTGIDYMYGSIGKGIYFEQEEINSISISKSKSERIKNDLDRITGTKQTTYLFIPGAHRFCVLLKFGITGHETYKFLKSALSTVVDKSDIVEIETEKDPKLVEEIFKAFKIHSIDYTISYTNDDTMSEIATAFDLRLKRLQLGKINVKAEADHNGEINTVDEDEIIKGGLELATSNGTINKVVITKNRGELKKTISSEDKIKTFEILANEDNFKDAIVVILMKNYREKNI